jgi:protein-S-isoprenylcysteine O-methyltransferase Ste14
MATVEEEHMLVAEQAEGSVGWHVQAAGRGARLLSEDMVSLFFGRVLPASLYVLIVLARAQGMLTFISQSAVQADWQSRTVFVAGCLYRLTAMVFYAVVAVVFIIRMQPVRKSRNALHIGVALSGSYMMTLCAAVPIARPGPLLIIIALVIMVAGTALTTVALLFLGRSFSITPEARRLVTGGLYTFVRHPMYLGEILGSLGLILPSLSVLTVAIFALFCFAQIKRMDFEESVLQQTFPGYELYKKRTARLVPGLY